MVSDEALAQIAYDEMIRGRVGAELGWLFRSDAERGRWVACARAVRAALTPAVAPLSPGEMIVTQTAHLRLTVIGAGEPGWLEISTDGMATRPATVMELDATGVAALREACDRWLAAQEADK